MASAWGVSWGVSWGSSWGRLPVPPTGGGGGGAAAARVERRRRRRTEWEIWREKERELLEKLLRGEDVDDGLQQVAQAISTSQVPQAQRVVRKISSYRGEIDQLKTLQIEVAKLEIALEEKKIKAAADRAVQAAVKELKEILAEDEEFLQIYARVVADESSVVLAAVGIQ